MLGKHLPQHITDKIAEKFVEEGKWLTEIGLASESMESAEVRLAPSVPRHYASFTSGRIIGSLNLILTVGLQAAGKQNEAELIARRFCNHLNREGIILGYALTTTINSMAEQLISRSHSTTPTPGLGVPGQRIAS